jgi:phage-related protein
MLYITKDESIDLEALGYILKTTSYQQIPGKRNSKQSVIGKDGDVTFTDGYENKMLSVMLTAIDGVGIVERRANAREINKVLRKPGKLVLDYENDIYYNAQILSPTSVNFNASYDALNIMFDLEPIAISRITGQLVWEDSDYSWELINIPWEDYEWEWDVTTSGTITVNNRGNVESLPLITIETTSAEDITLSLGDNSFTYTGLNGIVNIDCKNMVVYDDTLTNVIQNFSYTGEKFLELEPGDNDVSITGTCNIKMQKKDWFI